MPPRKKPVRRKKAPPASIGLTVAEVAAPGDIPTAGAVARDGGAVLGAYRDPFGGHAIVLAALPLELVEPTPYQRDPSDAHVKRLMTVIEKIGRFLDPVVAIRHDGRYWTPNGNHRLQALRRLGAKSIVVLLVPEPDVAFKILALKRGTDVATATGEGAMPTTLEKAQVTLPSDREVRVTRSFRAARPLVYRAYTEPGLVQRWLLGPPGWSMPVCEMDVRFGGTYRWRWRSAKDASEFGFTGTFREVQPPSKLVQTEKYDPGTVGDTHPQSEALVTVTFAEDGDLTTVTTLIDFGSKEARDAAVATGMTDGMEQSYQLLATLLREQG